MACVFLRKEMATTEAVCRRFVAAFGMGWRECKRQAGGEIAVISQAIAQ